MRKNKTNTYEKIATFTDDNGNEHIIFIYGELTENPSIKGVELREVEYKRNGFGGKDVLKTLGEPVFINTTETYGPRRTFNFGWAICSPLDKFDREIAIKKAKERFSKSGITTQDRRYLNEDMINAIINNEIDYLRNKLQNKLNLPPLEREKTLEEIISESRDGEILRLEFKNNEVAYAAHKNGDKFYWLLINDERRDEGCITSHCVLRTDISIDPDFYGIISVKKAKRTEVRESENTLFTKFNIKWDWENKKILYYT